MSFPATTNFPRHARATLGLAALVARRLRELAAGSLLARSGLAVFDQGVVSGTSFATSVLLARCISREELGVYYLALSVFYFARGIQEQLVSAPYMIYCGRKSAEELREYAGSTLMHQCVLMLATALLLSAGLLSGLAPAGAAGALGLLVVAAPLLLIREFARQMSFAHLHLARATALDVVTSVFQLAALLILVSIGRLTVPATLATIAVASGLATVGWLATSRQAMIGRVRAAMRDWIANWSFARWALASQLLASTTPYVMPWIVALTHGEAETGLLGAATTLVGLSSTLLQGLANFLSPQAAQAFARGGLPELRSVLIKTAALFAAALGTVAVVALLFGEQIAVLVFGAQFAGAGPIVGVLSLSVLATSAGVAAGNGLWAMERPSANFVADLASLLVVIGATVAFVPRFGPLGAAIATLAGTSTDAVVRLWILRLAMREMDANGGAA